MKKFINNVQFTELRFCFSDDQSERDADIFRGEVSLQRYAEFSSFFLGTSHIHVLQKMAF